MRVGSANQPSTSSSGAPGVCYGEASIYHVSFEGKPGLAKAIALDSALPIIATIYDDDAHLYEGARYGELCRATVGDFDPDTGDPLPTNPGTGDLNARRGRVEGVGTETVSALVRKLQRSRPRRGGAPRHEEPPTPTRTRAYED